MLTAVLSVLAAFVAGSGFAAAAAGPTATTERTAQARQACADRWGWMHNSYVTSGTRAIITKTSPCRISFDYGEAGDSGFFALPCEVNKFGAYECAGHAQGAISASTKWNAIVRSKGRLVLDRPPRRARQITRPAWVRRYPVIDGYIRPFNSRGHLRPGLSLHGAVKRIDGCGVGRAKSTRLTCVTGYACFASKLPLRAGDRIACPDAPGSKRFVRGVAAADDF